MKRSVVLLISRRAHLSNSLKRHGIVIARRLGLRIVVAYIDTMPLLHDGGERQRSFIEAARKDWQIFRKQAKPEGILVDSVHESGKIRRVVSRLCRILNNLEFIIVDSEIRPQSVVQKATVPVFTVSEDQLKRQTRKDGACISERPHALLCKMVLPSEDTTRLVK